MSDDVVQTPASRKTVRHLFPRLLENGYVPLPNLDKRCVLKSWPTVAVTPRQAALWARSKRWQAIGLRVEPPLLVVDIDVLDVGLVRRIAALLPKGTLRRIGRAPKEAHFLRYDGEPFNRIGTRRWRPRLELPAGWSEPETTAWSQVEIFAGGGSRQFGAFGPHSIDDKGNVLSEYVWPDGRSPAEVPIGALPVVDLEQVLAIADESERLMAAAGLVVDQSSRGGMAATEQVFDLGPGMRFDGNGVAYTLETLEYAARAGLVTGAQVRVRGSFTGDNNSSGSLRCRVGISHFKRVYVHDFKTGVTHHPEDVDASYFVGGDNDDIWRLFQYLDELAKQKEADGNAE